MLRLRLRLLLRSLNPFEVREVLQDFEKENRRVWCVSIPLKSGRCCKLTLIRNGRKSNGLNPFEVREVLQVDCVFQESLS